MTRLIGGFQRHYSIDHYGRRITFYVAMPPPPDRSAVPLLVYIQGSGCHSLFVARPGRPVKARQQGILAEVAGGRAAVLAVEKPGVRFLDDPGPTGDAEHCRPAFWREHTLDHWAAAIEAAVSSTLGLLPPNDRPVALIGQSEGGIVAAVVARRLAVVSHVALLGSSGPSQLFDLLVTRVQRGQTSEDVVDVLKRVERHPDRWRSLVWGHPHRRWSSFLTTSTLEELLGSRSQVLIVHGTHDDTVPIAAAQVLYAELLRHGRDVRLIEQDTGHDLTPQGQPKAKAVRHVFEQVIDWVLEGEN